jgi:hypothetical protein
VLYSAQLSLVDSGSIWSSSQTYQPVSPLFAAIGQLPSGISLGDDGHLQGTTSAPGEWPITVLSQDANGFEVLRDIVFNVVNPGQDVTPPLITPELIGENSVGDWYRSDVTIEWGVSDPESGATSQIGCETLVITQDTPRKGSTYECSARSIGGLTNETEE